MAPGRETFYNIITVLMLTLTVFAIVVLGGLAVLLPEEAEVTAEEPTVFVVPSATSTLRGPTQEPTRRATATISPSPTISPTPTITPTITLTPTLDATEIRGTEIVRLTEEFDPTDTPVPPEYVVQDATIDYDENPVSNGGCSVSVIAGDVLDEDGEGIEGLELRLEGDDLERTEISGNEPQYGDGGWEFVLGDGPRGEVVFIQLFDSDGEPLSLQIAVQLFDECSDNRALLTFVPAEG